MHKRYGFVTVLIASVLLGSPANAQPAIRLDSAQRTALGVQTVTSRAVGEISTVRATGRVTAAPGSLTSIISPLEGVVATVAVPAGAQVKMGDPLVTIFSNEYAEAKRDIESSRLMAVHRAEIAERAFALYELGLRSKEEADEAEHDAMDAKLAYRAISDRLAGIVPGSSAGEFVLTARQGGVVTHQMREPGTPVGAGVAVASIYDGHEVEIVAQLAERHGDAVRHGMAVTIDGLAQAGRVTSVDPELDRVTRSLEVRVAVKDAGSLRLGDFVELGFAVPPPGGALRVPTAAVVFLAGEQVVFVERDGSFVVVPVRVHMRSADVAVVSAEIAVGEPIAVSGLAALKNIAGEA